MMDIWKKLHLYQKPSLEQRKKAEWMKAPPQWPILFLMSRLYKSMIIFVKGIWGNFFF